jgi:thioredoxin:protein disulfide reductase
MRKTTWQNLTIFTLLLLAGAVSAGPGQTGGGFGLAETTVPEVSIDVSFEGSPTSGQTAWLLISYDVPQGHHMTTTFQGLAFVTDGNASFGEAVFPEPDTSEEIHYYHGDLQARVPVDFADSGEISIQVNAEYQLCLEGDAGMCFAPDTATAEVSVDVAAGEATAGGLQDRLQAALEQGSWLAFLLVFLGGVLASFTPCVYPMIPITISYIGGNSGGNPLKGFIMAVWYVLGIAIVYSVLGVLAAATGGAFGQATQTPTFATVVAIVIGAMGLSMAGLFDIRMPGGLTSKIGGGKTGFLGPLLMGMAMGLIAAPCVGPILIVLLTWVATTGKLLLGFWLLFTFALGLGMLFLALGTFSGLISALPGAGGWMDNVKHFFAVVLFALALSFLKLYLPLWLLVMVFGLAVSLSAGAWGVFEQFAAR